MVYSVLHCSTIPKASFPKLCFGEFRRVIRLLLTELPYPKNSAPRNALEAQYKHPAVHMLKRDIWHLERGISSGLHNDRSIETFECINYVTTTRLACPSKRLARLLLDRC